jgi:hypothetical protein
LLRGSRSYRITSTPSLPPSRASQITSTQCIQLQYHLLNYIHIS